MQMLIANQTAFMKRFSAARECGRERVISVSYQITQATVISAKNLISPKCFDSNFGQQVLARRGTGIFWLILWRQADSSPRHLQIQPLGGTFDGRSLQ